MFMIIYANAYFKCNLQMETISLILVVFGYLIFVYFTIKIVREKFVEVKFFIANIIENLNKKTFRFILFLPWMFYTIVYAFAITFVLSFVK